MEIARTYQSEYFSFNLWRVKTTADFTRFLASLPIDVIGASPHGEQLAGNSCYSRAYGTFKLETFINI